MAKKKTTDAVSPTPRRRAARTPQAVPPPVDGIAVPEPEPISTAADAEPRVSGPPNQDDIAREAYLRYLKRGGDHGRDFDDWLEAERELRSRR
jgi:hypothetical protein